ncbi:MULTISPECIES: DUF1648 domain-containing protein [Anoxybacillaceae]|jgi:uncharacterized membrane protein|uniref:DUF1648 domain-containing protein n=1 Tax=Anoxybacteroides rupiense TaxID=311460 RepID=A0ABD5IXZ9_9BACL|nr:MULTISPECIES: DUF1648 domain-containing protein [Anoxybacillus]MED5053235.1 DUF1648 domain-containing protein [Anoxybacillus rupiensis]OQM47412.1 hypothetical protein B6A27_00500 [Anoxybacillus sp. UARK-01]
MNNIQLIFIFILWIVIIFISSISPVWLRSSYKFGVPLSDDQWKKIEISQIIRKSILMNIIVGVVLALSTFMIQWFSQSHFYFSAITVPLFIIANIFIHIRAHVRIKRQINSNMANQPATQMVAIDTKFRRELSLLRMWYPIPFIMIFLNVFFIVWYYNDIPNILPIHHDASGKVDRYGEKSVGMVFVFNLSQLFVTIIFIMVQEAIIRSKQNLNIKSPKISSEQNKVIRYKQGIFVNIISILLVISISFIQLSFIQVIDSMISEMVFFGAVLIAILGAIMFSVKKQSIEREIESNIGKSKIVNSVNDEYWKGGIFYVNKEDPAIFVEQRSGNGFTINLGSPTGWFLLLLPFIFGFMLFLFARFV